MSIGMAVLDQQPQLQNVLPKLRLRLECAAQAFQTFVSNNDSPTINFSSYNGLHARGY